MVRVGSVVVTAVLAVAFAPGCGSRSAPATPPPTQAPESPCAPAKTHVYTLLTSDKTIEDRGGAFPAMASGLFDVCTRDHWSPAAIDCFAAAPAIMELEPCLDQLSAAQRNALEASWDEVMRTRPAPTKHYPPTEIAKRTVEKYAFEGYPMWALEHPEQACPARLEDLASVMPIEPKDPWGNAYEMACGTGVRGLLVISRGPDGKRDTDDDITSQ